MMSRFDALKDEFTYHSLDAKQLTSVGRIRGAGLALASMIVAEAPPCADTNAAVRKVREAVMTANAAIALEKPS